MQLKMRPGALLLLAVIAALAQRPIKNLSSPLDRDSTAASQAAAAGPRPGQDRFAAFDAPLITATPKGPTQINLSWPAVAQVGYGYRVEVESAGDHRYQAWGELAPIPADPNPTADVYQPPDNGIAPWVTEPQYIDATDGSAAQFIATGLLPNVAYAFRVRTYTPSAFGPYSNVASATTANYPQLFVDGAAGDDTNDGTAGHAWKTLAYAASLIPCGSMLNVVPGTYAGFFMAPVCTAGSRAVIRGVPGVLVNAPATLGGIYNVLDGMTFTGATPTGSGSYQLEIVGSHNALFDVDTGNTAYAYGGVLLLRAGYNLLYHNRLHDGGDPVVDAGQGGFVLTLQVSTQNVIWSNHLTRGSHDVSLCKGDCTNNRWLNNTMDGGWGMGFEAIERSTGNLFEGNIIWHAGRAIPTFYKPGFEISSSGNTARRNLIVGSQLKAVEVSALCCGDTTVGTLIYNNTLVDNPQCLFQSHNGGTAAYDGNLWANNICVGFQLGTDIYLPNVASKFTHNDFFSASGDPGAKVIIWAHETPGGFEYPVSVNTADLSYPPWSRNMVTLPRFVDPVGLDFHLQPTSMLVGAGIAIADPVWGPVPAGDLGMFGITGRRASVPVEPADKRHPQRDR